jgi:hypothetical protein
MELGAVAISPNMTVAVSFRVSPDSNSTAAKGEAKR